MKRLFFIGFLALFIGLQTSAQGSLAGRVYYCASIMKAEVNQAKKEFNKDIEKEKELTAADKKEANELVDKMADALVNTMTVKFLSDKELNLSMVAKFDNEKAKANGLPWMIRKMIKLKVGSKGTSFSAKVPYTFDGKTVKLSNPKTKKEMNFQLSADGKTLTYNMDGKPVLLKRTK